MRKTAVSLLTLAFLLVGASAFAGPYMKGKIGPYFPEESEFDTGFNLEASMGAMLGDIFPEVVQGNPHLQRVSTEIGLGYYHSSFDEKVNFPGMTSSVEGDLDVVPLTLTAFYTLPVEGSDVELFGGFGLGLYFAFLEGEAKFSDTISGTTIKVSDDDSEVKLGADFHVGVSYNLDPQLALQAELEYDAVSDDVGGTFLNFGVKYNF